MRTFTTALASLVLFLLGSVAHAGGQPSGKPYIPPLPNPPVGAVIDCSYDPISSPDPQVTDVGSCIADASQGFYKDWGNSCNITSLNFTNVHWVVNGSEWELRADVYSTNNGGNNCFPSPGLNSMIGWTLTQPNQCGGNSTLDSTNLACKPPSVGVWKWNYETGTFEPPSKPDSSQSADPQTGLDTIMGPQATSGFTDTYLIYPNNSSFTFQGNGSTQSNGGTNITAMTVKDLNGNPIGTASCSNGSCSLADNTLSPTSPYTQAITGTTTGTVPYRKYTMRAVTALYTAWAPVLNGTGITYSEQDGQYAVNNGIAHVQLSMILTNAGTNSGAVTINLPPGVTIPDSYDTASCGGVFNYWNLSGVSGTQTFYVYQGVISLGIPNIAYSNFTNTTSIRLKFDCFVQ